MWSSEPNRRAFILGLGAVTLSGCGFQPIFGYGNGADALFGGVDLQDPSDRDSFVLNDLLRERLGPPQDLRWALGYDLSTKSQGFSAGGGTRSQLEGRLNWQLTRIADGKVVASGTEQTFVGQSEIPSERGATFAPVSNRTAADDAKRRLLTILADRLMRNLGAQMAAGT